MGGWEPGRWGWQQGQALQEVGCAPSGRSCVFWRGPRWASVPGCRARRAVPCHPGAGCHGNQTSLLRDKQLDVLARFLQD